MSGRPPSRTLAYAAPDRNASDLTLIAKLHAFAKDNIPTTARQDLRKSETTVRYLAKVRQDRLPEVDRWLRAHGG